MQKDKMASKPLLNQHPKKDGAWLWMWIAHYNDGTSLPQYDPYTLDIHVFREVEQDKLIKFGLYPFPPKLAERLRKEKNQHIRSNMFLPKYEVKLDESKRVIGGLTTNFIKVNNYTYCPKCKKWYKTKNFDSIGIGGKVFTLKCKVCGLQSFWKCKECGKTYNHIDETNSWRCTECGGKVGGSKVKFPQDSIEERWRVYKLGYQQTINGVNQKVIMCISEDGNVELTNK